MNDLLSLQYSREEEGREVFNRLFKEKKIDSDFGSTYFGYFKNRNAFGYFKLYGTNNVCGLPGVDYRDFANELFRQQFIFAEGHVFMR